MLHRIQYLSERGFNKLWDDFQILMPLGRSHRTTSNSATRRHRQARAVQLAHHGCLQDSLKALTSAVPPLAPTSVWTEVAALFPPAQDAVFSERLTATLNDWSPLAPTEPLAPPDSAALRKIIASLPPGKCPGPSGLRNDHITHLPDATYASLARLPRLLLEGTALPTMARWLLSSTKLIVFTKSCDHGIHTGGRPIGVPELYRKLAGKWILQRLRHRMAEFFAPLQVGNALSGGCELAVLPTRLNLETEDSGLLSLDFSNAFNTVTRKVILAIWAKILPEALPFIQTIHATPPETFAVGPDWTTPRCITVEEGVQQGDPLGPSLFASALQLVLVTVHRSLHSRASPVTLRAYLDDVSVTGSPLDVSATLADISALAAEIHLDLNLGT